ncbi:portal protein [Gordonia phage Skog]|uniref:Portal protein n=1 Tax=Gordonia phage Skog TaxID=2704033 RepID=A0A6G6XJJ3_9CAUD|nr:portal protein [Gordonia phage Skog]QIG58196.1 portal protein [Gordonia phage Skog]
MSKPAVTLPELIEELTAFAIGTDVIDLEDKKRAVGKIRERHAYVADNMTRVGIWYDIVYPSGDFVRVVRARLELSSEPADPDWHPGWLANPRSLR